MKYIRTDTALLKEDDKGNWTDADDCLCLLATQPNYKEIIDTYKLKEADTIEELCDEFVVIYNESKKFTKPFTSAYCDISDVLKEHDINECKIYGAIWTDRGLIYAAKMNDKGELELL